MQKSQCRSLYAGLVLLSLLPCSTASAQSRVAAWSVDQRPQTDGTTTYQLNTHVSGHTSFGVPTNGVSLKAPNGSVLSGPTNHVDFDNFADLGDFLFGNWVVTESPTVDPVRSYTISLSPFTLSDVSSNTPLITSPLPGSTVGTDFIIKWDPNNPTSYRSYGYGGPGMIVAPPQIGIDGPFSVGFHVELLDPPPVRFPFLASVKSFRPDPMITARSPSLTGRLIVPSLTFSAYSELVIYSVVPEPGASVLIASVVAFLAIPRTGRQCK